MASRTVIKVGGSLLDVPDLSKRLSSLLDSINGTAILVGGGGRFADEVRRLDSIHHWPESISHQIALQTLSVSARLLSRILSLPLIRSEEEFQAMSSRNQHAVVDLSSWKGIDKLPAGWDLTSDSLAAWLAKEIQATQFLLLKSIDPPTLSPSLTCLAEKKFVDPLLPRYAETLSGIKWFNLRSGSSGFVSVSNV